MKNLNAVRNSFIVVTAVCLLFVFVSCGSGSGTTEEVLSPTQGIITHVKEMKTDLFKITDENIVNRKEDSRIIATYLNGKIDTFTLEQATLVDANNPRRSRVRGVVAGGMFGYLMGRNMRQPLSRTAYASDAAFNKSNTKTNSFRSTATRKTVNKSKSGFGSSKSTRSFGG